MNKSKIEWTDRVWNPVTGCTKVSQGCANCYAETYAHRFWGDRKFTDVQCHADRLDQPLRWKKSSRIFVNSMSDLFHEDVPDDFINRVFAVMALSPQHTFQVLTKRPERMLEYINTPFRFGDDIRDAIDDTSAILDYLEERELQGDDVDINDIAFPYPNVWLGVSVEDQATADERIPFLLETPAALRFVSYEPALGPVDLRKHLFEGFEPTGDFRTHNGKRQIKLVGAHKLHWIIMGGESGQRARPMHPDWARSVRDQCASAGVPFFFKQWGEWVAFTEQGFGDCPKNSKEHFFPTGKVIETYGGPIEYAVGVRLVGKKRAGHLLDGEEHREFPHV